MAIEGHMVTDESKKDKNGLKNDQIPLDDQLEDMFDYEPEEEDDEEETEGEEFHEKNSLTLKCVFLIMYAKIS